MINNKETDGKKQFESEPMLFLLERKEANVMYQIDSSQHAAIRQIIRSRRLLEEYDSQDGKCNI